MLFVLYIFFRYHRIAATRIYDDIDDIPLRAYVFESQVLIVPGSYGYLASWFLENQIP